MGEGVGDMRVTLTHGKGCHSEDIYLECRTRSNEWKFQAGRPILVENKLELFFKSKLPNNGTGCLVRQ